MSPMNNHSTPPPEPHSPRFAVSAIAGVAILCGGRSARMGRAKAWLPIDGITFLERLVETTAGLRCPVTILAGLDQQLPDLPTLQTLPPGSGVTRDREAFAGPLISLARFLAESRAPDKPYLVCSCDAPLLTSRVIDQLCGELTDSDDAVVPVGEQPLPLLAIYRGRCGATLQAAIATGERRLLQAIKPLKIRWIPIEDFRQVDPRLASFANINTPADYHHWIGQTLPDELD